MTNRLRVFAWMLLLLAGAISCSGPAKEGEAPEIKPDNHPIAVIIEQATDTTSSETADQLAQAFTYSKIPHLIEDINYLDSPFKIPRSVRVVCVTFNEAEAFTDAEFQEILAFVARGNTLFVTTPVFEERFNFLTGIKQNTVDQHIPKSDGFIFKKKIFPGYRDSTFKLKKPFYHNGIAKEDFKKSVETIAYSQDSTHTPIITENRIGKGRVYLYNSKSANDKLYRGLLFSVVLPSLEGIPYPVANVSTIFLDDFPLPLYSKKEPPIDWEYDITEGEFIANVWWPDMKALADTFNIDYTALLAFNYNGNVVPPFDFDEWESSMILQKGNIINGSIWLAHKIRDSRHELGLHGYNHISLWLEDWPNQEFMVSALKAASKRWRIDNLGPPPVTYVPPNNDIDSVGLSALHVAMPQMKYMSSLYIGEKKDGAGREFSSDPYQSGLFDYPRISSGFVSTQTNRFDFQSLYLLTGIWTHFLHPDDVFQIKDKGPTGLTSRNELGLGWHRSKKYNYGLYEEFRNRLRRVGTIYPLNRYLSAKEAAPIVKTWRTLKLRRGSRDNMIYAAKVNPANTTNFWFLYIAKPHLDTFRNYLEKETDGYHLTPVWNGYLAQFKTEKDSLSFPDFWPSGDAKKVVEEVRKDFKAYIEADEQAKKNQQPWKDTRLDDALAALKRDPSSHAIQEQVISLAIEFDRTLLAVNILEQRLANHQPWSKHDVNRLLTYYGWTGTPARGFSFLEHLWKIYHNEEVIMLEKKMAERYGAPDEAFVTTWLQRSLQIHPGSEHILHQLVVANQSEKTWPQTKTYLQQLIRQNPKSDSLYFYTLQRSFYYDKPDTTLQLLQHFPKEAQPQLTPLAPEIANLYAYTAGNYTKALQWADRAADFSVQTKLEWLLQQKRYKSFIERGDRALLQHPQDDSLRVFIGQQLMYAGFYEEGYKRLYPLFEHHKAPKTSRKLVHTEIGYQSYDQKKAFYKKYPAFFSDSLRNVLQHKYRMQEAVKAGLSAHYASDNFDNIIAGAGAFAEWGNRSKYMHHILAEETFVNSGTPGSEKQALSHAVYRYQRQWQEKGVQFTAAGGFYYGERTVYPDIGLGLGYGVDSTYTSFELALEPELTATALKDKITKSSVAIYREDHWIKGRLESALSLTGKRYSNDVYAYEGLGRLYLQVPFSTAYHRFRVIGEGSFSDASTSYTSGIPYYTPDQLLIGGAGAGYRYRNGTENPSF